MTDQIQMLLQTMLDMGTRADASRRAHLVIDVVLMSFLVDAKIATPDQICRRIDTALELMPDEYRNPDVVQRLQLLKDWLRHHEKEPTAKWAPGGLDRPSGDS